MDSVAPRNVLPILTATSLLVAALCGPACGDDDDGDIGAAAAGAATTTTSSAGGQGGQATAGSPPTGGNGGDGAGGGSGGGGAAGGSGPAFSLDVYVEGDLTPKTLNDGYAGQTPTAYTMGLSRFDLMKSESDPAPTTVFDHGDDYVELDMLSSSLAGTGDLLQIPPGLYTHGRALLMMTRFDVETTVHVATPPAAIPGTLTVVAALSDTTIDGEARQQGWVEYTFDVLGGITVPGTLPAMPSSGGGTIVQEAGKTWLVFPMAPALTILPTPTQQHTATITYEVFESFRWEDQSQPNYNVNVFDALASGQSEPVHNFGATGYSIVTN